MTKELFSNNLGAILYKLRDESNLTQEKLAEKSGLSKNYISDIERGKKNISAYCLFVIAKALGVSVGQIFEEV